MAREIGLSRLTAFELTDANAPGYDPVPIPIPYVVNIETSKNVSEYSAFGDNIAEISSSKETGATLTIEVSSDMPPKLEALLTGKKYQNGSLIATSDDTKKVFGLAWETIMSDGNLRRYFYFNCSISKSEHSNQTISDSITAQTYNLTVGAIPLPVTKELMMVMDEKEVNDLVIAGHPLAVQIQQVWEEWFTTAPRPVV